MTIIISSLPLHISSTCNRLVHDRQACVVDTGLCHKVLESSTAHLMHDDVLTCKQCQRKLAVSANNVASDSASSALYVNHNDANCCRRCGKRVYFAEQVLSLGRKWHRSCFSCCECHCSSVTSWLLFT